MKSLVQQLAKKRIKKLYSQQVIRVVEIKPYWTLTLQIWIIERITKV